jgi:hypothetical protein
LSIAPAFSVPATDADHINWGEVVTATAPKRCVPFTSSEYNKAQPY